MVDVCENRNGQTLCLATVLSVAVFLNGCWPTHTIPLRSDIDWAERELANRASTARFEANLQFVTKSSDKSGLTAGISHSRGLEVVYPPVELLRLATQAFLQRQVRLVKSRPPVLLSIAIERLEFNTTASGTGFHYDNITLALLVDVLDAERHTLYSEKYPARAHSGRLKPYLFWNDKTVRYYQEHASRTAYKAIFKALEDALKDLVRRGYAAESG